MPKKHKNSSTLLKKINFSLLLKIFLLWEVIRQLTVEASAEKSHDIKKGSAVLAVPDFFGTPLGLIAINPIVDMMAKEPFALIDTRLAGKISSSDKAEALSLCDDAIHEILRENTWIPSGQFLNDLSKGTLKIILAAPEISYSSQSIGSYSIKNQHIIISYKPGLSKEDYKKALLNELMSHLVVMSHRRCGIVVAGNKSLGTPFLRDDGTINQSLKKQFEESIKEGIGRVDQVKSLWEHRKEKLTPAENHLLIQFLAAAKHYKPQTINNKLSEIGGIDGVNQRIASGVYRREGNYIESGPLFPAQIPFFRGQIVGTDFIYHHTKNIHSAEGRIQAFLGDLQQYKASMDSPDGPYAKLGDNERLAEFATFIAQFPRPLLQLFFQKNLIALLPRTHLI